jgi:cell division protein FtsZ
VQGISDIITIPGIINRDFADVKTIMAGMGYAVMGTATGEGRRPRDRSCAGGDCLSAAGGGRDRRRARHPDQHHRDRALKLAEVNEASTIIQSAAHEDANIIFGAVLDEKMKDEVKITVIATGFRPFVAEATRRASQVRFRRPSRHAYSDPLWRCKQLQLR